MHSYPFQSVVNSWKKIQKVQFFVEYLCRKDSEIHKTLNQNVTVVSREDSLSSSRRKRKN